MQGAIDGAMSGAISGAITGAFTSPYCFVAGTAILTGAGYVAIENIKVGDIVWSTNPDTGETALKEVLQTYVNETNELIHVTVDGEEIVTTPSHPFYIPRQGWTDAIHLKAGDILLTVNGEYVVVEKVQHELLEAPIKVYNFEVEDFHTYYVGDGVLVHNSCNHGKEWKAEKRRFWKKTGNEAKLDADYGSYIADEKNIERMMKGLAPKGKDGYSVHLHHWKGIANDFYDYSPISRTLHIILHSKG